MGASNGCNSARCNIPKRQGRPPAGTVWQIRKSCVRRRMLYVFLNLHSRCNASRRTQKKWQLPHFPYAASCRQGFIDAFGYVAEPNASSLSGWPFILDGTFGTRRCCIARWVECKEGRSGESISQSADHARAARSASIGRAGYGRRLSDKAAKSCVV